jgi:hypothetical protein
MDPFDGDSFGAAFTGSASGGGARDAEFYAWINAAFADEGYNGSVKDQADNDVKAAKGAEYVGATVPVKGGGLVPAPSHPERDWSEGGWNWRGRAAAP